MDVEEQDQDKTVSWLDDCDTEVLEEEVIEEEEYYCLDTEDNTEVQFCSASCSSSSSSSASLSSCSGIESCSETEGVKQKNKKKNTRHKKNDILHTLLNTPNTRKDKGKGKKVPSKTKKIIAKTREISRRNKAVSKIFMKQNFGASTNNRGKKGTRKSRTVKRKIKSPESKKRTIKVDYPVSSNFRLREYKLNLDHRARHLEGKCMYCTAQKTEKDKESS